MKILKIRLSIALISTVVLLSCNEKRLGDSVYCELPTESYHYYVIHSNFNCNKIRIGVDEIPTNKIEDYFREKWQGEYDVRTYCNECLGEESIKKLKYHE